MPKKKSEKQIVTKLKSGEIFDALRDGDNENIFLCDGLLDEEKVTFVAAKRKNGDIVPLALLLDKKAAKTLDRMTEDLQQLEEDGPGDDDDDADGDDGEDEDDDFEP